MSDPTEIFWRSYVPRPKPLAIPETAWNDAPVQCLQVNDQWASHIIGVLEALAQRDTWLGDETEIDDALNQVDHIIAALMEVCEDMTERPIRLTEAGEVESQHPDTGDWLLDRTRDPREHIPLGFPPAFPESITAFKTACANAVIHNLKAFQASYSLNISSDDIEPFSWNDSVTAVMYYAPRANIAANNTSSQGGLADIFYSNLAYLLGAELFIAGGRTAFDALFTATIWQKMVCHIWCAMSDDCTISYANWLDLVQAIYDDATLGDGQQWLRLMMVFLGRKGLTNLGYLKINDLDVLDPATDCTCA